MATFPIDPLDVTAEWMGSVLDSDVQDCRLEQIGIGVGLLGRLYRAHSKRRRAVRTLLAERRRADNHDRFGSGLPILEQCDHPSGRIGGRIDAVDPGRRQRPAVGGVGSLFCADVAAREGKLAGLIE